ncbi:hypothetical protein [Paenibacillus arenilitoris]|uniref:Uncharacterized protein n=1 Tax=Paenibacillus arenilitoris TaxID=2772299 RepID=A0A927CLV5_9BACL|nr:hypothetical protein [Paenibacillus arenilitoris]MBD2868973.1 hypothetical protein [Paenibacillus arenilitoris]
MIKIETFLLLSQQTLNRFYTEQSNIKKLSECFTSIEDDIESLSTVYSSDLHKDSNDFNMAIIINMKDETLLGYENWGYDLWRSYLTCLSNYVQSNFDYGHTMYGIDPYDISFKNVGDHNIEFTLRFDGVKDNMIVKRFVLEEKNFIISLINAAEYYYMLMQDHNFSTPQKLIDLLNQMKGNINTKFNT